jgi:hypothetical protein
MQLRTCVSVFLFTCLWLIGGCGEPPRKVIERVPSPDHVVDAVALEIEVGATVATPYLVYIVPSGSRDFRDPPVLRADNLDDLKLSWKEPRFLEVSYSKGRIFDFTNFWESKDVQNFSYVVEIRLRPYDGRSLGDVAPQPPKSVPQE